MNRRPKFDVTAEIFEAWLRGQFLKAGLVALCPLTLRNEKPYPMLNDRPIELSLERKQHVSFDKKESISCLSL